MIIAPGDFIRWQLEPEDEQRSKILSPAQLAKLQTMNVELAESLAEFIFEAGGDSGNLLNATDFWMLRGRRSLVLQLLNDHNEATGISTDKSGDNGNTDN